MGSANTTIEWTDRTWNPIRGCTRVSPGCQHCYAERIAARFSDKGMAFEGLAKRVGADPRWTGKIMLVEKEIAAPLKWKKPERVFVNSVSDLFHPGVPFPYINRIFQTMLDTPHLTYQILTKRPERMFDYFQWVKSDCTREFRERFPLPNVWLGTSVENQQYADERIPWLLKSPAAVRFLSIEPLLGPVDISRAIPCGYYCNPDDPFGHYDHPFLTPGINPHINLVIVGGESGPGARPMHPDWARSLRDQCQKAGVNFFFKQWGEWLPCDHDPETLVFGKPVDTLIGETYSYRKTGKKAAGRLLDGQEWNGMPELVGSKGE